MSNVMRVTKEDLQAALAAGGLRWDEGHWVARIPECRCGMCRGIRIACAAAERFGHQPASSP